MKKIKTLRFGEIEYKKEEIFHFKNGLLAFENSQDFLLLDIEESPIFKWLQSLDDPEIAFLLTDPFILKKDYSIEITKNLQEKLAIQSKKDVLIYTTVTVPESGLKEATTNLLGPLIFNTKKRLGKQLVLEDPDLDIKHPLFPQTTPKKACLGG